MSTDQVGPTLKIVLSKKNVIFPREFLINSPTRRDGCSLEDEIMLRIASCERIQHAGRLLELPQPAIATAQILFQRFYLKKSMFFYNIEVFAIASVILAGKCEESVRRIRDVVNVFKYIEDMSGTKKESHMFEFFGGDYIKMKGFVIDAERRILKELGFLVHVQHSHKWIVSILKIIGCENNHDLIQKAWSYMNDSLRMPVFLFHQTEPIACACIYLAARSLNVLLPSDDPGWWTIFGVDQTQLIDISKQICYLYTLPKLEMKSIWDRATSNASKPLSFLYEKILVDGHWQPNYSSTRTH